MPRSAGRARRRRGAARVRRTRGRAAAPRSPGRSPCPGSAAPTSQPISAVRSSTEVMLRYIVPISDAGAVPGADRGLDVVVDVLQPRLRRVAREHLGDLLGAARLVEQVAAHLGVGLDLVERVEVVVAQQIEADVGSVEGVELPGERHASIIPPRRGDRSANIATVARARRREPGRGLHSRAGSPLRAARGCAGTRCRSLASCRARRCGCTKHAHRRRAPAPPRPPPP